MPRMPIDVIPGYSPSAERARGQQFLASRGYSSQGVRIATPPPVPVPTPQPFTPFWSAQPAYAAPSVPAVAPPVQPQVGPAIVATGGVVVLRALLRALGGKFTLGMARNWMSKYGPPIVRLALGAALFGVIVDAIDGGLDDDAVFVKRRSPKRYTIGANPRLNTLLKVAKRVDNIFVKYESRMKKFRGRAPPRRSGRKTQPPYAMLSPVELAQLGKGR